MVVEQNKMKQNDSQLRIQPRKNKSKSYNYNCRFVCLFVYRPTRKCSLIWRRLHYRWSAENFDLCSALMAIEKWGFFSVPHLLWHWASVYNCHLRRIVTLTPTAERLAMMLTVPVLGLSRLGFEHPTFHSNPLRHRRGNYNCKLTLSTKA